MHRVNLRRRGCVAGPDKLAQKLRSTVHRSGANVSLRTPAIRTYLRYTNTCMHLRKSPVTREARASPSIVAPILDALGRNRYCLVPFQLSMFLGLGIVWLICHLCAKQACFLLVSDCWLEEWNAHLSSLVAFGQIVIACC